MNEWTNKWIQWISESCFLHLLSCVWTKKKLCEFKFQQTDVISGMFHIQPMKSPPRWGKDVRLGKKTQTRKSLVPLPEWEINLAKVTCHTRFYNNFVFFRARALRVNYCCHVTWTPCISFIKQNNKNTYKSLTKHYLLFNTKNGIGILCLVA